MELFVERFAFRQHGIHDGRKFFCNQCPRDRVAFATLPSLELDFDFWEILDRANRGMVKGEFEIPIAIA